MQRAALRVRRQDRSGAEERESGRHKCQAIVPAHPRGPCCSRCGQERRYRERVDGKQQRTRRAQDQRECGTSSDQRHWARTASARAVVRVVRSTTYGCGSQKLRHEGDRSIAKFCVQVFTALLADVTIKTARLLRCPRLSYNGWRMRRRYVTSWASNRCG